MSNQQHCWLLVSNLINLAVMPIGVAVIIIIIIITLVYFFPCLLTNTAHSLCVRLVGTGVPGCLACPPPPMFLKNQYWPTNWHKVIYNIIRYML